MNKFDYLDNWDLLDEDEELPELSELLNIALEAGDSALFNDLVLCDLFDHEMAEMAEMNAKEYNDGL